MLKNLEVNYMTIAVTITVILLLLALIAYITYFTPEAEPPRRSLPVNTCYISGITDRAGENRAMPGAAPGAHLTRHLIQER